MPSYLSSIVCHGSGLPESSLVLSKRLRFLFILAHRKCVRIGANLAQFEVNSYIPVRNQRRYFVTQELLNVEIKITYATVDRNTYFLSELLFDQLIICCHDGFAKTTLLTSSKYCTYSHSSTSQTSYTCMRILLVTWITAHLYILLRTNKIPTGLKLNWLEADNFLHQLEAKTAHDNEKTRTKLQKKIFFFLLLCETNNNAPFIFQQLYDVRSKFLFFLNALLSSPS